jgi:hypothetical protein
LENSTDSGTKFEIVLDKIKGKLNDIEEQAEETMNNSVGSDPK